MSSAANLRLAGSLDPAFGTGGVVTHSSGGNAYQMIGGIAVQPDRKVVGVVAGGSLVRYLADGSLDSSFGEGGYVATGMIYADAVALQPDGKIVVAGASGPVSDSIATEFAVARYDPDGSPDTSFGTNGTTKTIIPEPPLEGPWETPWSALANALAVLPGGDIVAAGTVWGGRDPAPPDNPSWSSFFALVRYTADGSLDPTFGDAGIAQTAFGWPPAGLNGIAVQPDGKIVASGSVWWGGHGDSIDQMVLARYEPDGTLDPGFGTAGTVATDPELTYVGGPPVLQQGKILVAGWSGRFPVLARWKANGRLDSTFGQHGMATIRVSMLGPSAILAQNDGKILIAEGRSPYSWPFDRQRGPSTVVRLLPTGRLDTSFARGGIVSFRHAVSTLALQTDQKILVGGGDDNAWTLARIIGGNNCVVPALRGKTIAKAAASLKKSYCRRGHLSKRYSSKVTHGRVISTAPPRGVRLPGGTKVQLVVSRGKRP